MKVVSAGFTELIEKSIPKKIERVARVCYKSEDLIGPGTDLKMVRALIDRKHTAMLEHASIAFTVDYKIYEHMKAVRNVIEEEVNGDSEPRKVYLRFTSGNGRCIVSGNMRAWVDVIDWSKERDIKLPILLLDALVEYTDGMMDYLQDTIKSDSYLEVGTRLEVIKDFEALSYNERLVHEDISVLFTVDRGVTHEMVRMRDSSFAQESTRYVNYSKGKYGNEITVISPCFWEEKAEPYTVWKNICSDTEKGYMSLLNGGAKPQEARDVLPQSVKADIVITTNIREWRHILNLRACDATGPAHPQIKEVMVPLLRMLAENKAVMFRDLAEKI